MAPAPCALGPTSSTHQQSSGSHKSTKGKGGLLSKLLGGWRSSSGRGSSSSLAPRPSSAPQWTGNVAGFNGASSVACGAAATVQGATAPASSNQCTTAPFLGYATDLEKHYELGRELGKGGNGVVRIVKKLDTGEEFACKSIRKVLTDASEKKKQGHLDSIRREIQVMTKLSGSLNIVKLEDVYEDEDNVHVVMELCAGGELWHRIGDRHYSERTVASFMRAVLRTLAQCHAQHILHRDIKPGNFMLLTSDDRAPLKAIDFGLAAPFDPEQLPRTDLGLEGTPWYMAPETLRGEWLPASDLWAAGVMAFQMLCGRFPFDDKKNVYAPAITAIWRSVLNDELDFSKSWWAGISDEAKDFCKLLLNRDPKLRPTAKEALKHPWLRGNSSERSTGKKLGQSVVARIQRFASGSQLKRTVLQSIAAELLSHPEMLAAERERCAISDSGRPIVATPDAACLAPLMKQMRLEHGGQLTEAQLSDALAAMGFRLAPSEVTRLMEQVDLDGTGVIDKADFAASQMDWRYLQRNHTELWLELAGKAFREMDKDGSGVLTVPELLEALRARLPPDEVQTALELALQEAGSTGASAAASSGSSGDAMEGGIDFEGFLNLLKVGSVDSLDLYDDRMSVRSMGNSMHGGNGSIDRYNSLLAASIKTSDWSRHGPGGSRHGDVSVHSATSDVSDVSALPDKDNSLRAGSGMTPASPAAAVTPFRFDTGTGVPPKKAAAGSNGIVGNISTAASGGAANGASGGMVWRFDVAGPAQPPPAPTSTVWRFDVAGGKDREKGWDQTGEAGAIAVGAGPLSSGPTTPAKDGSGSSRGTVAATALSTSTTGHYLGRQGGYYDRRHHGATLYRNAALNALNASRLHTVAE
ncbi:hypothetical protein HYH02_001713 [Chlamydomonas schloesseri]|uniref:Uncharacterized protein n=1 Tax=Chlamydomonas schloesseri TaxID=2026947 RepID=A0A835WSQ0_9CHLO|nr:hypothetical protein HYH02_001713 [Chlamydomonas schloesseri]|eukprot:KAG2453493.1 hypothetical protein HYH02_001713 [Chlamydomonas schloesseri]